MIKGLIGKKIGMSQLFTAEGKMIPVTVLQAGPCVITQIKTPEKDGYSALQIALIEKITPKRMNKCVKAHLAKAGSPTARKLVEILMDTTDTIKLGDKVTASDVFKESEYIDITGISKGRGFQGVVKRHHFGGGSASHGSKTHRRAGSIGASSYPSRVWKGQRMGGRMSGDTVTVKNLTIVKVDIENNLILVKGSIPGFNGSYVVIKKHQ